MQKLLSAIVHSSSASLLKTLLPDHTAYFDAYRIYARVVGGIAIYLNVPFDTNEQTIYDQSLESLT